MNAEDRQMCDEIIAKCVAAKEKGVCLFLAYTEGETNIYCCSSGDAEVIRAMGGPETANLGGDPE